MALSWMGARSELTTPSPKDLTHQLRGCTWGDLQGGMREIDVEGEEVGGEEDIGTIEDMVVEEIDMMTEGKIDMVEIDMVVIGTVAIAMVVIGTVVVTGTETEGAETDTAEIDMERTGTEEDQEGQGLPVPTTGSKDQGETIGLGPGATRGQDTEEIMNWEKINLKNNRIYI